ncbi:MAG: hypothetical protein HQK51_08425 [Oligoflexia bacterium]|nr:hypothetical protein [Oligoflexia bacterium]
MNKNSFLYNCCWVLSAILYIFLAFFSKNYAADEKNASTLAVKDAEKMKDLEDTVMLGSKVQSEVMLNAGAPPACSDAVFCLTMEKCSPFPLLTIDIAAADSSDEELGDCSKNFEKINDTDFKKGKKFANGANKILFEVINSKDEKPTNNLLIVTGMGNSELNITCKLLLSGRNAESKYKLNLKFPARFIGKGEYSYVQKLDIDFIAKNRTDQIRPENLLNKNVSLSEKKESKTVKSELLEKFLKASAEFTYLAYKEGITCEEYEVMYDKITQDFYFSDFGECRKALVGKQQYLKLKKDIENIISKGASNDNKVVITRIKEILDIERKDKDKQNSISEEDYQDFYKTFSQYFQ